MCYHLTTQHTEVAATRAGQILMTGLHGRCVTWPQADMQWRHHDVPGGALVSYPP